MADSNSSKQSFSIKDLKCQKVVVFTDRAEVKRVLKTKLKKGENEVTLTGVTSSIDQDSVRVEGHGNATVVDVVCQTKAVTEFKGLDSADSKIKELKNEIKSLEEQIEKQKQKLERNERQTGILNDFAATLSKPVGSGSNGGSQVNLATLNSTENVTNFINFLSTYTTKVETLDAEKLVLKKEIKELEEKLTAANDNLNRQIGYETYTTTTDVNILLESAADDNEVELIVSYLVYSASWSPKYDIRVFSKEKSMNINYYGMICQSTGEDWNDVKLSLSTAVPSIGGNVPELETQNVRVKVPVQIQPMPQFKAMRMAKMEMVHDMVEADMMMPQAMAMASPPRLQMAIAEVSQSNVGSTATFDIARNSTIPSDSNTHKVSIGLITLQPEFEYQTVPRKNSHAYLKAKVVNKSQFPLLAGPANVFLDQNFVSKIDLKSYSPQEEFDCSLGVDPGIRIDYKPVRKFKSESGLLSKSTSTTYQQEIEVKNTTSNAAKILLIENLPLSNDDKIQVKLAEPSLKNNSNVKLNKKNNLEFELNIPANKAEQVVIKYSVDHPSDKEIEFF